MLALKTKNKTNKLSNIQSQGAGLLSNWGLRTHQEQSPHCKGTARQDVRITAIEPISKDNPFWPKYLFLMTGLIHTW